MLAFGKFEMGLGIEALRTLAFIALVFGSQAIAFSKIRPPKLAATRAGARTFAFANPLTLSYK
jgi:hypothetical protein